MTDVNVDIFGAGDPLTANLNFQSLEKTWRVTSIYQRKYVACAKALNKTCSLDEETGLRENKRNRMRLTRETNTPRVGATCSYIST